MKLKSRQSSPVVPADHHEKVRRILMIRDRLELYRLTPDVPEYDVRRDEMATRGTFIPELELLLGSLP